MESLTDYMIWDFLDHLNENEILCFWKATSLDICYRAFKQRVQSTYTSIEINNSKVVINK